MGLRYAVSCDTYSRKETNTVTEENMALLELAEKHSSGEFLKELGQWTLHG